MYAPDVQWWPPHPGTRPQLSLPTAQQLYDIPFHFARYRPEEIGCVSRIASRSYPNDDRNKRFLRTDVRWLSDVNFDLLWGYPERYIRASTKRSERAIHHILTWWLEFGWRQQADPRYGALPSMSVKKLRWWAQSFLGGVPRILVGFKNDEQTVVKCKMFDVTPHGLLQAVPPAREMPDFWKPAVCMNFLAAFLSFVKEVVVEDNYALVHVFSWNPHEDVHYSVKRGPEHCFLLPQYVQCVMTQYR